MWKFKQTEDQVACLIEARKSAYALDTGRDAEKLWEPIPFSSHWAEWQQWIVCRLPLS